MPRQLPAEITLDELNSNPCGYQIMAGEAMPLFPKTENEVEMLYRSEVYGRLVIFLSFGWENGEKACTVQKLG